MGTPEIGQTLYPDSNLRGLLLVALTGGWFAGIIASSWLLLSPPVLLAMGTGALLILALGWRNDSLRLGGLLLLAFCLGAWRYAAVSPGNDPHAIRDWIATPALQIQGTIVDDPRLESQSTLFTVDVLRVSLNNGQSWREAHGQVQVQILGSSFADPYAPRYGDMLQLAGQLKAPPDYATPELQASMAFPRMSITARAGSALLFVYQLRSQLAGILLQTLPQPYAALMIALLLSLRTPALKPLLTAFNVSGTAHLIAASGFKVTLFAGFISAGTRWLLPAPPPPGQTLLPAKRRQRSIKRWLHTSLLILCTALYTLLSGAGPAAIRAGLMGILLLLAPRLKRSYNVYTALALAALLMSIVDPFVIWDSGFQLSFIGTLGILLFTPFFQRLLRFLHRLPTGVHVSEIFSVTLAAQVATLPLFALDFNQLSFIAPLANLVSVPLLGILLALGTLICVSGLIALPLALVCGWLAWPFLWYAAAVISWCAQLPGAYLLVNNLSPLLAWLYYAVLIALATLWLIRWPPASNQQHPRTVLFSRRTRLILQGAIALLILLTTGFLAQTTGADGRLTIALLSNGDPSQGQALFLRTPSGQTILINEGASSTTFDQTLDTRLPFWQRSLGLVILSDTSANDLAGLQDIITRYQVQRIIDGGMLHPSLAYARWRSTLSTRNLPYTQTHQGTLIIPDKQVTLQVLWPPAHLHQSSQETLDNALVLRLVTPGLRLLLLNAAALSNYTLQALALNISPASLQANIVQLVGENNKAFPSSLTTVLNLAHPSLLLLTTRTSRQATTRAGPVTTAHALSPPAGPWNIIQNEQASSLAIQSNGLTWSITSSS